LDTRIGYPKENLEGDSDAEMTSPMYATAVGLVLNSLESKEKSSLMKRFPSEGTEEIEETIPVHEEVEPKGEKPKKEKEPKDRLKFFEKWAEKFKEFLDNAE